MYEVWENLYGGALMRTGIYKADSLYDIEYDEEDDDFFLENL
jgi:hypothetical protein